MPAMDDLQPESRLRSILCWSVLGLLLAGLLVAAATFDHRRWPALVGDEAAYLMQAQSLAWDFDLLYSRGDYERFLAQWGRKPDGLILQSGDGGKTLTYGKPLFYSLYLAPFVRLAPVRGAPVANALLLALAAVVAAASLRLRLGAAAPVWVAAWVFASVAFAQVFWVHADLFMMSCTALALALAYGGRTVLPGGPLPEIWQGPDEEPRTRFLLRWLAVGLLLGVVGLSRPFYGALLLPAALAMPAGLRRRSGWIALLAGAGGLVLVVTLGNLMVRGSWTSYGGERQGFYSYTGFPDVDLPAGAWRKGVEERGGSWITAQSLNLDVDPSQAGWNVVYYLLGRHVGIVPYFLPLVLGFLAYRRGEGRWALVLAVVAGAACFLLVRPFNFYGGGGALANRYFLPLYPAFWFLAARPVKVYPALLVTALAAPFLWPLWSAPRAFLLDDQGGYRYVSSVAQRSLPYETTQSHLKPSGQEDVLHNGLWLKPLTTSLRTEADGSRLRLAEGQAGSLLLGFPRALAAVRIEVAPPGVARLDIRGGEVGEITLRPDGGTSLQVQLAPPRARHRMWWMADDVHLYELHLAVPDDQPAVTGGLVFRIYPLE